jgi:hypothetical protein
MPHKVRAIIVLHQPAGGLNKKASQIGKPFIGMNRINIGIYTHTPLLMMYNTTWQRYKRIPY